MSVHLFVRSCYSLLQSTVRIPDLVRTAGKLGYSSLALTDHNVMHGSAAFIDACRKAGIHPIIGLEADVDYHERTVPFLLLAKDNRGYVNLMKLSSLISESGKPASLQALRQYSDHNFLIAYGEGGVLDGVLVSDNRKAIVKGLSIMKEELPPFSMALSYQEASLWKMRNAVLKQLAANQGIPTVALNKVLYLKPEDASLLKVLTGIREGKTVRDQSLFTINGRSFLSKEEMAALYDPDDLERTDQIARECMADFNLPKTSLPVYETRNHVPADVYLKALCETGLKKRLGGSIPENYQKRLDYELSVILKMHFENYFLIVYDFILHARRNGIYVGPGRGSAAGSLVAWSIGITEIDPIRYHLLFERFLNPERISMPDIDTDFPDNRRDEIKQYVYDKYGHDHAAGIVTFMTFGARQAVSDAGKVLNLNERDVQMILRQIPKDRNGKKAELKEAYRTNARLREIIQSKPEFGVFYQTASALQGLPKACSIHPAGMILSSLPLDEVIPTEKLSGEADEIRISQIPAAYLEAKGLIKIDFLSLRNLTVIDAIADEIRRKDPTFNILHIPLDDPRAYHVFASGDTTGIFQFESAGMKNLLKRMKPRNLNDIASALALYRPGPISSIDTYFHNRANPQNIVYPDPRLKPVLEESYGVMIYQEQIMLIARIAAGFSLGKADILRKAISKKKPEEMERMKGDFLEGCRKNGYASEKAAELFAMIEKFAGYGINKSHAVAYAVVAYQTAYLKGVHPRAFYTSLLSSAIGDETKSARYIRECRFRHIRVLYPDVNRSEDHCTNEREGIRLPLSAIHGIGTAAARQILSERKAHGPFRDYYDLIARLNAIRIDRTKMEALIDGGAMDSFQAGRRTLKYGLDEALQYADLVSINKDGEVRLDLGLVSRPVLVPKKDDPDERNDLEKEALGFNLGTPPIVRIREQNGIQVPSLAEIQESRGYIRGFGGIRSVKKIRTRKGDPMAFITLSDETGEMDAAVMPRQFEKYADFLLKGNCILFDGKIDDRSMIIDHARVVRKR